MPRHLLSKKYPGSGFEFGPGFLERRPEACATIALIISLWSEVDFQMARLFASFMGTDTERTIAVFVSLRSARIQRQVLRTAAKAALPIPRELQLFDAVMAAAKNLESERNDLAHGLLGTTDLSPDGVLWVSVDDRVKVLLARETPDIHKAHTEFRSRVYVYDLPDLQELKQQIELFQKQLYSFVGLPIRAEGPERDQLYDQLASQSPIREELAALREKETRRKS